MQALSPTGKFDFIKFDIEGAELEILQDEASHPAICEATCIFMELHDRLRPGCTDALNFFLRTGCGRRFDRVTISGEFELFCQTGWTQMSQYGR